MTTVLDPIFYHPNTFRYVENLLLEGVENFDCCDDYDKDHLIASILKAYNFDIDIILSAEVNHLLAKYLLSYDSENKEDLLEALLLAVREQFSDAFNQLFSEVKDSLEIEDLESAGKIPRIDPVNGEVTWV